MSSFLTYGDYRRSKNPDERPHARLGNRPPPTGKRQRIAPPREDSRPEKRLRVEEGREGREDGRFFLPTILSFKAFLATQEDSITDDEAISKYAEYKLEFNRQQLNEFFVLHKEEEWFQEKYHPDLSTIRHDMETSNLKRRVEVFMELYNQGSIKELRLDSSCIGEIETLLDCFVLRLEGGSDEDLLNLKLGIDLEQELHKTTSIHIRSIHPHVKREELESVCKKYPGFLRLALSDPLPENRWMRKGWITFARDAKIKEICLNISSVRLKNMELTSVLNKDLSQRIRPVSSLTNDKKVMKNDIKLASRIIKLLDNKWNLWETVKDDIVGEKSFNPVLENITEYLIEEMSAEEDELLGYSANTSMEKSSEGNDELTAALDRLVLYLRLVHSVDYYKGLVYQNEDEMPNRSGIFHVRDSKPVEESRDEDIANYIESSSEKVRPLLETSVSIPPEQAVKLGTKDETEAVEIFVQANTEELGDDKYLCPLSGKKFKGTDFVRKHIFNKHPEKVEEVKKGVLFFNSFIQDPKRPKLAEKPKSKSKPVTKPAEPVLGASYQPIERGRTSVKDRLGYRGGGGAGLDPRASSDPRGMIDYSDLDFNDDLF
jgi:hypothetical protein